MCGIVGYTGAKSAATVILGGLKHLEYRGYDSAGLSEVMNGQIATLKSAGQLSKLCSLVEANPDFLQSRCGIGHARWATHGPATDQNAHPHTTEKLSLVHNGIIENYRELQRILIDQGYDIVSDTDTEIAAKMIDSFFDGNVLDTLIRADAVLEGSYAFGILFASEPDSLYGMRRNSPLIVGLGEGESFLASDISAILEHTRSYYELEEGEIVHISGGSVQIYDAKGKPVTKETKTVNWDYNQAMKGDFPHFMLKEIMEQPIALEHTLRPRINEGCPSFDMDQLPKGALSCSRIHFVACGTAYHAGLIGKELIESIARIPVEVSLASEFRYRNPLLPNGCLVIAISQSGETADTLAALRLAKQQGVPTLGIVNVPGSTLSREADMLLYTHAGPEISVASTKAFSVQVGMLYMLAAQLAFERKLFSTQDAGDFTASLMDAVGSISQVLSQAQECKTIASWVAKADNIFFIGRGLDYFTSMEGSLKLKEITYIHSEAYAAGELKHGAISLIVPGMPVIALATQDRLLPKMISNIREAEARGAHVLLLCKKNAVIESGIARQRILLPDLDDHFMTLPASVALQLIAYYSAVERGCDVDKPRNLAKSVTVE